MRKTKTILVLLICLSPAAAPAANKPAVDFKQLRRTCESSWAKYKDQLGPIEKDTRDWIGPLGRKQVATLYDANDQLVIFATGFFPNVLDDHYDGWELFNDCYTMNQNLLRDMPDRSRSHADEVEELYRCLKNTNDHTSVLVPLDETVACYRKQATQFKP